MSSLSAVQKDALDTQAVNNFREYLRIPSVHPDVNYDGCVTFLQKQGEDLDLGINIYYIVPRKPIVILTWVGTEPDLPTILLNSHMDVVPVFDDKWTHKPFDADVDDQNNIYARGTQDMKCVGIQYIEAVRRLKQQNIALKRTLHLSFMPDEEIGGADGMRQFVHTKDFTNLNVGVALDEGMASPTNDYVLFYSERCIWYLHIHCPGTPGHGSLLLDNTAGEKATNLLGNFFKFRRHEQQKLRDNPGWTVGDVITVNLTQMRGGVQNNVVPPEFVVAIDCRIPPENVDVKKWEQTLNRWCQEAGPGVWIEFIQKLPQVPPTRLDNSNAFWIAFKEATDELGLTLKPQIFPGGTDSRYVRGLGIPAIGFSPINNTPVLLHDHDEYLGIGTFLKDAQLINCPKNDIHFEKVLGLRPSDSNHPLLLFQSDGNQNVTTQCLEKCESNDQCRSFVIYFSASACYWFKNAIQGVQELENEVDTDAAWFIKVCLKVSVKNCEKLWVFERVPGATLVGNNTKILPQTYTRSECQQNCLNETQFDCKSAKFKIKRSDYGPNDETVGTCILSNADRHVLPNTFRASSFDDEYFENQCSNNDQVDTNEFCSYEEYDNATLSHSDVYYQNETKDSCRELCEKTEDFNCRGYSLVSNTSHFDCFLHSEDSKVHGPRLLQDNSSGKYFEKVPCLNITITCTETYMTVRYAPKMKFMGRMYMEGYSEQPECSVKGQGTNMVVLKLSVLSEQCGIIKARALDNRTLMAGTMILQYNPLVQTQGDRNIRVGCIYGNDSKVLVGTGITITSAPSHASPLLNTTGAVSSPNVEMRVLDLLTQKEVSSTQIGQELQLIIELKPFDGSLDIWAGHLVAMTEKSDESILLIDDRGCPTNINIFPALTKITTNTTKMLVANFQAFKFSSSPIVRFSVIVQFCPEICPAVDCGNDGKSYGRKKREIQVRSVETINGTTVVKVNRSDFEKDANVMRMPLEFVMIVRNPTANSDRLVLGDGKILVAGYDYIANEVCLDYNLFVGLIVTWVLIQIIFITCCIVLVKRYKKYYEHESTTQSLEQLNKNFGIGFSNLDNRRVHWADNGDYT